MSDWVEICRIGDIPSRGARVVQREGATPIAVFRTASDGVFALLDRCPHRGGPLSQGLVTGDRVVCPLHGWTVELGGGRAVAPDEGCAQTFAVEVRDDRVYLRLFPLTPTLSPNCGGEGAMAGSTPPLAADAAVLPRAADAAVLPLPAGRGWGEG